LLGGLGAWMGEVITSRPSLRGGIMMS
jgi:hypothetical protein